MLDQHRARGHQRDEFRITEFLEQAPDIAVDGFAPQPLAVGEVSADEGRENPWIASRGIQGNGSAFTVSGDSHRGVGSEALADPVYPG